MKNTFVTDTQALIKHLVGQKVINDVSTEAFKQADIGQAKIIIPAVVLFEIGYLHEKGRIHISLVQLEQLLSVSINYVEQPLNINIIKTAFMIKDIPELHDRLIAGTAKLLDVPVITNDPLIIASRFVDTLS